MDPKGNSIVHEYLLPDLSTNRKGRIRTPEDVISDTDQILIMNNERFTVPELIFHPDFIGVSTRGLVFFLLVSVYPLDPFRLESNGSSRYCCRLHHLIARRSSRIVLGEHWFDRRKHKVPRISSETVSSPLEMSKHDDNLMAHA
jgi:hypothetical protein